MVEKIGRIYIIRNTVNSKVYVGQTVQTIKRRFQNHLSAARRGKGYVIGKAIRKYGEDKFYIELIEECTKKELNVKEVYWAGQFKSTDNRFGYNISKGGNVTRTTKKIDSDLVINMFNEGISAFKIARILHTDIPNITKILKENHITYGIEKQKINNDVSQSIVELYQKGYKTMELCRKFNISKHSVRRILLRNNIKIRTKSETKNLGRDLPTL